jgi:hypothetical protein
LDSRQDGKKFPGCLKKTVRDHRFLLALVSFILVTDASLHEKNMKPRTMAIQRSSRISLAIFIICLCFGSLVVLPMMNAFSLAAAEISGVGAGNNDPSDQAGLDDEFLFEPMAGVIIARFIFSKFGPMNLDFQTVCLAPVSPPPKYA